MSEHQDEDGDETRAAEEAMEAWGSSKEKTRHTSEPSADSGTGVSRVDAIKEALVEIEEGDAPENINVRDSEMKALLVGLDDVGSLDVVAEQLADHLDDDSVETEDVSQSDVARLWMRVGLRAVPEVREDAVEAARQKRLEEESGY